MTRQFFGAEREWVAVARAGRLPSRVVQAIARYSGNVETLVVSRWWHAAAAAALYRTVRLTGGNVGALTHTLLDPSAHTPYSLLVRRLVLAADTEWLLPGDLDTLLQLCPMLTSVAITSNPLAGNVLMLSLADSAPRLHHLSLRECPLSSQDLLKKLCDGCRRITSLDLSFSFLDASCVVDIISRLPVISRLSLEGLPAPQSSSDSSNSFSFPTPPHPKHRPLTVLNLRNSGICSPHVHAFAPMCPSLSQLYLDGCVHLTDDAIVAIAMHCPLLEALNLSLIPSLSDLSLFALSLRSPRNLKYLAIAGCTRITPKGVQMLIDSCFSASPFSPNKTISSAGNGSADSINSFNAKSNLTGSASDVDGMHASKYSTKVLPTGSLKHLVMHGCPNIIHSYLAAFDLEKTMSNNGSESDANLLECMLEGSELKAAFGAKDPSENILPSLASLKSSFLASQAAVVTSAAANNNSNEYSLEPNELWMLAAYNMRVLNSSFESLEALSDSDASSRGSNRSSVQSLENVGTSAIPSSFSKQTKAFALSNDDGNKRMSSQSSSSSVNSKTGSGTRLPVAGGSKLPASKLRQPSSSVSSTSSSLPKLSGIPSSSSPRTSRLMPPSSSASRTQLQQPQQPTKINFSAYNQRQTSSSSLLARPSSLLASSPGNKAANRLSSMTTTSYSRAAVAPPSSSNSSLLSASGTQYKPRGFKKFNDSGIDEFGGTVGAHQSRIGGGSGAGPAATKRLTPANLGNNNSIQSMSTPVRKPVPRGIGSALKPPSKVASKNATDAGSNLRRPDVESGSTSDSVSPSGSASGLDRWRTTRVDDAVKAGEESNGVGGSVVVGSMDKWRQGSGDDVAATGLERWRKTASPSATPVAAGGGASRLKMPTSIKSLGNMGNR